MMTAKDFRALTGIIAGARALADEYENDPQHCEYADGILDATEVIAGNVARHAAKTNPRFDRGRFMAECGIEVEEWCWPSPPPPHNNHHTNEVNA